MKWSLSTLVVYVDDIAVTGDDLEEVELFLETTGYWTWNKEFGKDKPFLGIEVAHSKGGIFISPHKYILDLIKETRTLGCKLIDTPIGQNDNPDESKENVEVDCGRYQCLVVKLIYLSHSRPV